MLRHLWADTVSQEQNKRHTYLGFGLLTNNNPAAVIHSDGTLVQTE